MSALSNECRKIHEQWTSRMVFLSFYTHNIISINIRTLSPLHIPVQRWWIERRARHATVVSLYTIYGTKDGGHLWNNSVKFNQKHCVILCTCCDSNSWRINQHDNWKYWTEIDFPLLEMSQNWTYTKCMCRIWLEGWLSNKVRRGNPRGQISGLSSRAIESEAWRLFLLDLYQWHCFFHRLVSWLHWLLVTWANFRCLECSQTSSSLRLAYLEPSSSCDCLKF